MGYRPEEMKGVPFYRLMGFVIDKRYRNNGIGGCVLESEIKRIYDEFGVRPIALGVHKDNMGAERFYLRHGFRKTESMEGNDDYYLRYPNDDTVWKPKPLSSRDCGNPVGHNTGITRKVAPALIGMMQSL